jgi:hypothetical protein
MDQKSEAKKTNKVKGFFSRIFANIDKKMEEKAKSSKCGCCGDKNEDNKSCCS